MGKIKNSITLWKLFRAIKKETKQMSKETSEPQKYSAAKGAAKSTRVAVIVGIIVAAIMKSLGDKIPAEYSSGLSDALYVVVSAAAAFGVEFLRNFIKTKWNVEIKGLLMIGLLCVGLSITGCAFGKDASTGLWKFEIFPDQAAAAVEIGTVAGNTIAALYTDLAAANAELEQAETEADRAAAKEKRDALLNAIETLTSKTELTLSAEQK